MYAFFIFYYYFFFFSFVFWIGFRKILEQGKLFCELRFCYLLSILCLYSNGKQIQAFHLHNFFWRRVVLEGVWWRVTCTKTSKHLLCIIFFKWLILTQNLHVTSPPSYQPTMSEI